MVRSMPTSRRIFPYATLQNVREAAVAKNSEQAEMLALDVTRLTELVKKQQEVIIEFATRETWPEKTFREVVLDKVTSVWLEGQFGDSCSRKESDPSVSTASFGLGEKSKLFNSAENLERVLGRDAALEQPVLSWSTSSTSSTKTDNAAVLASIRHMLDVLDLKSRIAGLDEDLFCKSLEACGLNADKLEAIQSMACALAHMSPYGGHFTSARLSNADVLGLILAGAVFGARGAEAASELREFLEEILPAHNFIASLEPMDQDSIRRMLQQCVVAADPANHWAVVHNLDLLTAMVLDDETQKSGFAISTGQAMRNQTFTESALCNRVFVQGLFRAMRSSKVARTEECTAAWMKRDAQQCAPYADSWEGNEQYTEALMALNLIDFVAMPLWTGLTHHLPGFQEPLGHLFNNRETFERQVLAKCTSEMENLIRRRSSAFADSFGHIRYDSSHRVPLQGETRIRHTRVAALQNELENESRGMSARRSTNVLVPSEFQNKDFIGIQAFSLRTTGATQVFLARLGDFEARTRSVHTALTKTMGLLEHSAAAEGGSRGSFSVRTDTRAGKQDRQGTKEDAGGKSVGGLPPGRSPQQAPGHLVPARLEEKNGGSKGDKASSHGVLTKRHQFAIFPKTFMNRARTN